MLALPRATPTLRQLPRSTPSISQSQLWHRRHSSSTSSTSSSLESPSYPGLYYHPIPSSSPPSYTLSFLPTPAPSLTFSPTTIGTLHTTTTTSLKGNELPDPTPRQFKDNPEFSQVLQEIIKEVIAREGNKGLETMAKTRPEDGWIHITDQRTQFDVLSRVPDPSDIIASLLVQNGEIIRESYQPSGTHRLVTIDGMMKLEHELFEAVKEKLGRVRGVEEEIAREAQK
ncbi:BZ3500_MvSof-1268-A1-R1_Chr6-3g08966 [Microbotryum saponariae]|uniref:BZ3500_MvSof-1268-A1-R1_Chr6-3g08966 protein n=1 Tax=Microbotryum saponariae TaxID=289078 RepID=A0A2X0LQ68_9BASI|nr:BZ3500_MvSof-1268-A1-R1_Chr6-3g08966 [Microbotryum saponariae]SDA07568.1 BZ3501_MvSof-1269-A2-R1_Chr6-2g08670 [Microbotryum saponariae]